MTDTPRPRRSAAPFVLWGILATALLLAIVLVALRPPPEQVAAAPEKAVPVRIRTVVPRNLPDRVDLPGRLAPLVSARLATGKAGRVVEIAADKGDRVRAGQLLVRIDSRTWDAALARARTEQREAKRAMARWTELRKTGAVSVSDYDAVQARVDLADAAVAEAEALVSQCRVVSPVDGVVNDRYVEIGEQAAEGAAVLEVVRTDRLKLLLDVPERDVFAVRPGADIPFVLDALPGRGLTGTVSFVAAAADPRSHVYRVEALVDNEGGELRAGLVASASLERGVLRDAVALPLPAVLPKKGEYVVFVADGDRAVRRVVHIQALVGEEAVLSSGVRPGEAVVVEGQRQLVDGALLEVRGEER